MKSYPIKFIPILKHKIWGGKKLNKILNKESDASDIGESWEISTVDNDVSIIANGAYKNESLQVLLNKYKDKLVGKKVYRTFKNNFPLLIKFIDANTDLSVQLHPNDKLAMQRHKSFGKTEMWYIMQSDAASRLILGFKDGITSEDYQKHLNEKSIVSILNEVSVAEGDTYFLPTGTVHAIGAGILLAEIQQTSDITYRVYDWDRVDANGKERELHIEDAIEAINFEYKGQKSDYIQKENAAVNMVSCNYFTTNHLFLSANKKMNYTNLDSFVIYMCVSGCAKLCSIDFEVEITTGETVLLPASLGDFTIETTGVKFLEVFI